MKKLLLTAGVFACMLAASAQSEKYTKVMLEKIALMDTTWETEELMELSAAFERIALAEKTLWHPYYYAALTQVNAGLAMSITGALPAEKADPIADKAEALIAKAEELSKDNSEIFLVKKMISNLRMAPGEMARYMKYGPEGVSFLETAKKLNPDNPRVYLLEAQDKYFTPEQFGGSKTEAKKLFESAQQKFDTYKPAGELDPDWGRTSVQYFLNQIK